MVREKYTWHQYLTVTKCSCFTRVTCKKWIVGKGKINNLIEHSALILSYSRLFFSVPTKVFNFHLLLLIHFKYILSPFLVDCCSAELELSALALES